MKKGKVIEKIDHHSKFSIESQVMTLKRVKIVLNSYWYTMTSILDPSNLSQTPILESILERPTFYFTETVKFRLFQQFPNPYFILPFF